MRVYNAIKDISPPLGFRPIFYLFIYFLHGESSYERIVHEFSSRWLEGIARKVSDYHCIDSRLQM